MIVTQQESLQNKWTSIRFPSSLVKTKSFCSSRIVTIAWDWMVTLVWEPELDHREGKRYHTTFSTDSRAILGSVDTTLTRQQPSEFYT
jgi:hypothetical protein